MYTSDQSLAIVSKCNHCYCDASFFAPFLHHVQHVTSISLLVCLIEFVIKIKIAARRELLAKKTYGS